MSPISHYRPEPSRHIRSVDDTAYVAIDAEHDIAPEILDEIQTLGGNLARYILSQGLMVSLIQIGPLGNLHPTKKY
jgi:hypothetical protein